MMKKEKLAVKKLKLHRETVRRLSERDLHTARGGLTVPTNRFRSDCRNCSEPMAAEVPPTPITAPMTASAMRPARPVWRGMRSISSPPEEPGTAPSRIVRGRARAGRAQVPTARRWPMSRLEAASNFRRFMATLARIARKQVVPNAADPE